MALRIGNCLPSFDRLRAPAIRLARFAGVVGIGIIVLASLLPARQKLEALPAELDQRQQIRAEVARLFAAEDYAQLETLAGDYRSSHARTSSGVWKLTVFYSGVHDVARLGSGDAAGWRELARSMGRWRQAFPQSPTPFLAEAIVMKQYALSLRPHSLIVETSAGPDRRFVTALLAAQDFMIQVHDRASSDPHYYVLRANLASALGADAAELLDLVEEGAAREPAYFQTYFAALDHFAGHPERESQDIEAFANLALARSRQSEGLAVYARLYWYVQSAYFGAELINRTQIDWTKMRQGIEDVLARYPDPWNVSHFAYLACLAGDRDTLGSLMTRLGDEMIPQAWPSRDAMVHCQSLVPAKATGDHTG